VTFVRTVLGDIDPSELGVTYAHEHVVIDGGRPVLMEPDFDLGDVEAMTTEIAGAAGLGLQAIVDAMPCDAGRNVLKLAELSRRTGVHVIAPTGLHHDRYYGPAHWSHRLSAEDVAELFVLDITEGIDELDYSGPVVRRTRHRAGVIKVAGSMDGPSERDRKVFEAAAIAHARTGVPILTHCERGTGALEQVSLLTALGVHPSHVTLSHCDKIADRDYHRQLLRAGVSLEYDQSFRSKEQPNPTAALIAAMIDDGYGDRIVLGMDAARRGYYRVYGGSPGFGWLLDGFTPVLEAAGVDAAARRRLFVDNPARAFVFGDVRP
jgi:predicted metal-dependent phosphotriesterase family hydrolase